MARFAALIALCLAASASAFTPVFNRAQSTVVMSAEQSSRRGFVQTVGAFGAMVGASSAALADGAQSMSTRQRSKGIYGARIVALDQAVAAGDFAAVEEQKNAFVLFVSGGFTTPSGKVIAKELKADYANIFAAVSNKDQAALKSSYAEFVKKADIRPLYDEKTKAYTQGYSTEYDWKAYTPKGTIYQR
eukprot:CAMPEP_0185767228 /NCGR_PEP_ID=MMETSP1174-20130828/41831_1 /TAXON_ID=35687 /ORGANISM="Dictyocha speculum, Strain CCMP1381" /LENGTH=188 /DNA_ID=CAMNT_0028451305 /DNA_START=55 /DNA_END=621 /DNA_ORIENTATION=+